MSYTFDVATGDASVTGYTGSSPITKQIATDAGSRTIIGINASALSSKTFSLTSLVLPTTLTTIGASAYASSSGINGPVNLSALTNLQSIGANAFNNCSGLNGTLTLPSSLTSLGNYAFTKCNKLDGVLDLSNLTSLVSLGYESFSYMTSLDSLILPTSLTNLGGYTFFKSTGITGLLDLSGLTGLTNINNGVFSGPRFTTIILPDSLTTIGGYSFGNNPSLLSIYFQRGCTLQTTTFSNTPNAIVYSYNDAFTVVTAATSTAPASSTTGTFSPTVNPLSSDFSKWRLYDYPYPNTTSYYKQGVSSFTLQYNQFKLPTFYTYSPVSKEDYVVRIDGVEFPFTQSYSSVTKRTTFSGGTLIPSGSQELTIDDIGPMYLNEGLTVTQNGEEVAEVDVTEPFTLLPFAPSYVALFDGTATDLPEQQFNQCPFTIYENNVQIQGGNYLSEDLTLTPYFKESRMFARSIIYTLEPDVPVMVQLVDANTGLPMSEPVESTGSYYIGNLRDGSYYLRIVNDQLIYDHTIIADICFVKGTIVKTDQGLISIDKITNQTLNRKPITVTKTIHHDPYLVKVSAGAFGELPTRDTYMSLKHHIIMDVPVMAKNLINGDTITEVPYDDDYLYNVLVDTHTTMRVHGMLVETLDPNSIVGLFYRAKLSPKQKNKMIRMINEEPERAKMMLKVA